MMMIVVKDNQVVVRARPKPLISRFLRAARFQLRILNDRSTIRVSRLSFFSGRS
jgi:hypothetical protein